MAGSHSLEEVGDQGHKTAEDFSGFLEEEVDAEGQEEAIVKEVRDRGCPTPEERERHYKTHVSFHPWCPVCVEAKGIEGPHHSPQQGREHEIPLDYKSSGQSGDNEDYKGTAMIVKDRDTRTIHGHIVNEKGVGDGWIVSKLMEYIVNLGYTELVLKGDGEPALVQVMNDVTRQRPHKTILEHPPAFDPLSNGAVEKAVDQFMCQLRAIKIGLVRRIGKRVETNWPVLTWVAEHAAMMLKRYQVGRDGRTAYRSTVGKKCVQKLC